jgi:hypothetical protein
MEIYRLQKKVKIAFAVFFTGKKILRENVKNRSVTAW